jgi:hypothetical protein
MLWAMMEAATCWMRSRWVLRMLCVCVWLLVADTG